MDKIPMNQQEEEEKSQLLLINSNENTDAAFTGKIEKNDDDEFPIGYRFCPQDDELIIHYLRNKIFNNPLPHNKIPSVNLYNFHPNSLTATYKPIEENEWYFFTPRDRKYPNGSRPKRAAGNGFWKATGADKDIKYNGKEVGKKKSLVFYEGKPPKGQEGKLNAAKTNWIMHEFKIIDPPPCTRNDTNKMRLDDWVLCKIHDKNNKRKVKGMHEEVENVVDEPINDHDVLEHNQEPISGDSDPIIQDLKNRAVLITNGAANLAPLPNFEDFYHYSHLNFDQESYHHPHIPPGPYHHHQQILPGSYHNNHLPPDHHFLPDAYHDNHLPPDQYPYSYGQILRNSYLETQVPGGFRYQNEFDVQSSSLDNCNNESSPLDNYINTSSDL